jgi:hypothetical protein
LADVMGGGKYGKGKKKKEENVREGRKTKHES